ncbi:hypothetical protein [Streptomyces goshikiensis]|uniref:hypothetical protein n=1 Tax=Streptomyces goshikiensis TaxID=1942 RepID=UPI003713F8AB
MNDAEPAGHRTPGATRRLLRTVRADPRHMPERKAVFAVELLGSSAAEWVAQQQPASAREADAGDLEDQVVSRGVRTAVVEGSFLGGPLMVLLPLAFCGALLAQLRMVLELAALSGRDPRDQAVVADILVIQGVYPTIGQAESALREAKPGSGAGASRSSWLGMVRRQAYLIGLVAPEDQPRGKIGKAALWAGVAALVAIGMVLPLVWVPASGEMYRRATHRLATRATRHFAQHETSDEQKPTQHATLRPGLLLVALRTLVACFLPALFAWIALAADVRIVGSHEITVLVVIFAVAVVAAVLWYVRRR